MILTRVSVSVAIVLSVAIGLAVQADPIALPDTPYSMSLPGSPECDAEAVEPPIVVEVPVSCSVVVDGLEYTFDYWLLPYKVPRNQADGAMFAAALGYAAAMDGEIVDKQVGKVAGFPSMDFTIAAEDRRHIAHGRYVIVRTHLVRAVVEATVDSVTRESVDDVLESLRVK